MNFAIHLFCFCHTCKTFNILTTLYFIMTTFTHINSQGEANMVDVSAKA
ncbi:MAG: cyclic pyranopterin monophosphate synthase MoaC, partial [Haemophilus parainfluenzae]|nr:cyclic pyranopterin monophosphate synthase MoaC [Haemophilus parainfluenzae]